ncbi:glycosyltransferase family 2 protein [Pseudomonadota bacterium]
MSSSLEMQQIDVIIPTYNGADCILDTLKTVFAQVLPDGWSMQVYMVDDASTDETQALVRSTYPQAKIVELSPNQGRSIARNRGVAAGEGGLLCFLDSDCQYQSTQVLAAYIQVLNAGADASFGPLDTDFPGFWGQYQRAVYAQRIAQAQQGNMQVMTSNNFVLRRSVFERVQGFYTGYTHYGFEDYDLLQRLLSAGCDIRFCANASANHKNNDTLGALCHKLKVSAQYSAPLFMQKHPQVYAAMSFAKVDARLHPALRYLSWLGTPLLSVLTTIGERAVHWPLPYSFKKLYVQGVMALSYLRGSTQLSS